MAFSLFPDPQLGEPDPRTHQTAYQISVFLCVILGCGLFLWKITANYNSGSPKPMVHQQEIFQSLPPQVLEFSLRGASY
jgi:hypothetical protein